MQKNIHWINSLPWEVVALMLIWVVASQFSPATVDSVRDIYQANAIATGKAFPLTGPQLAHTVHLGPLWFYLLAVPAAVFGTWSSIAFLAFFLSALKFWLAYVLGKELHSKQLGLLFALFLALPGWSSIQLVIWTHTIVLETTLLLYLLSLRRSFLFPGTWSWLLTGFCFSLALHAHPTALPFIFVLALAWRSLLQRWYWTGWLLLGMAVPFLPYFFEQWMGGFPDLGALQLYRTNEFSPGGPLTMAKLLYSVVVVGPNLFYKTALPAPVAVMAMTLHWSVISVSFLLGLWRLRTVEAKLQRLLAGAAAMLIIVVVTVVFIRARTPWHLAYAPGFALAFFYAVLATIAWGPHFSLKVRGLLSTTLITLFFAAVAGASFGLYSNSIRFQEFVLYDVKNLKGPWSATGMAIPAFDSQAHGDFLCQQAPIVLHGPYAALMDTHVGIEAEMSCGKTNNILIGGTTKNPQYRHLAGITAEMNEILGSKADKQIGNVYFYQPLAVSDAGQAIPLADGNQYPFRQMFHDGSTEVQEFLLEAEMPNALLISKPVGPVMELDIQRVTCNGTPVQPVVRSNYAWLYRCSEPENHPSVQLPEQWPVQWPVQWPEQWPVQWQVWYVSSAAHLIDAVLLPVDR